MAMAHEPDPALTRRAFWATGWSVFLLWNLGTLLGAVGAASLADPAVLGLDAAIPAGFLALLWPRLVDRSAWALAVVAALAALLLAPVLRPGVPVIAGAALAVGGALLLTRAPDEAGGQP
jgi:predicted branched-subunit amino acid permease